MTPDSPSDSPQVEHPHFDMRDRVYERNPYTSFPPFITQTELDMMSSPTNHSSSKAGTNVTPNSSNCIKTGQWMDKLPSTKRRNPPKTVI